MAAVKNPKPSGIIPQERQVEMKFPDSPHQLPILLASRPNTKESRKSKCGGQL